MDGSLLRISPWGVPTTPWAHGDTEVTPEICGAIGESAQMILVWVNTLGIQNTSH